MSKEEDLIKDNSASKKAKKENKEANKPKKVQADNSHQINMVLNEIKMSKAVQMNFEEDIPNYVPLNKYWATLADQKRVELEDVLEENERLFNLKEILLEINKYFKEILKQSQYVNDHKDFDEDGNEPEN